MIKEGVVLGKRYEILGRIGSGGMADVYKGKDHKLNRYVAIKVLKSDYRTDEVFIKKFLSEAQAAAGLMHPNVVNVYDVGQDRGLYYMVMELVEGITLKDYIEKKGRLSAKETISISIQMVTGIQAAHNQHIIHRDIKPQNIIISKDGKVKVTDFGIAKMADSTTVTTNAAGSVHYISPEQARGGYCDERSDIYSLGITLYEMLTGRLPFDGDTPVSVAIQHISAKPMSPREIVPDIPIGLEEITMKAMASRIDQRYMNAEAMLRDLEEFRKNPQVEFHYNLAAFHGAQPVPEEPTQPMDGTGTLGRRQRQPVRTRTAPPPRRYPPEKQDDYEDDDPRDRRRNLVIPIVVVVFIVAVGVFLWLTFFSGIFDKEDTIKVPNLLGEKLTDVLQDEEVLKQFKVVEQSREPSSEYEEGEIIRQDPEGGSSVSESKELITINVVVSSGQETIEMINVVGDDYDVAVSRLQQMDLKVDTATKQASDTVEEGKVISSNPVKGAKVSPGDRVQLVISTGPDVKKVAVPTLTGISLDNARSIAHSAGLNIGNVSEVNSDKPAGQVIYQSVAPNTQVDEGTSITLQVSKGPETKPEVTKTIEIALPTDGRETVTVQVTLDGKEVYTQDVKTDVGTTYVSITGSGTMQVCVYFDGELATQFQENFDE